MKSKNIYKNGGRISLLIIILMVVFGISHAKSIYRPRTNNKYSNVNNNNHHHTGPSNSASLNNHNNGNRPPNFNNNNMRNRPIIIFDTVSISMNDKTYPYESTDSRQFLRNPISTRPPFNGNRALPEKGKLLSTRERPQCNKNRAMEGALKKVDDIINASKIHLNQNRGLAEQHEALSKNNTILSNRNTTAELDQNYERFCRKFLLNPPLNRNLPDATNTPRPQIFYD